MLSLLEVIIEHRNVCHGNSVESFNGSLQNKQIKHSEWIKPQCLWIRWSQEWVDIPQKVISGKKGVQFIICLPFSFLGYIPSVFFWRFKKFFIFYFLFFLFVVNFVIHWNEKALGSHVFPIPIPPPSSLPTRSLLFRLILSNNFYHISDAFYFLLSSF